jgi:hypothetical protein
MLNARPGKAGPDKAKGIADNFARLYGSDPASSIVAVSSEGRKRREYFGFLGVFPLEDGVLRES